MIMPASVMQNMKRLSINATGRMKELHLACMKQKNNIILLFYFL